MGEVRHVLLELAPHGQRRRRIEALAALREIGRQMPVGPLVVVAGPWRRAVKTIAVGAALCEGRVLVAGVLDGLPQAAGHRAAGRVALAALLVLGQDVRHEAERRDRVDEVGGAHRGHSKISGGLWSEQTCSWASATPQ